MTKAIASRLQRLEKASRGRQKIVVISCHDSISDERVDQCLREAIGPDIARYFVIRCRQFSDDETTRSEISVTVDGELKASWP